MHKCEANQRDPAQRQITGEPALILLSWDVPFMAPNGACSEGRKLGNMNHNVFCVQPAFEVGSILLMDEMKEGQRKAPGSQKQTSPCHGMQALGGAMG